MADEIERKFLVDHLPDLSQAQKKVIRQGYLTVPADSVEVRLRQQNDSFVLSLKTGDGLVRTELETTLSGEQFETLWPATADRRLEKIRWTGPLGEGLQFELDVYSGTLESLVIVEVEFASEQLAAEFEQPSWFGADVTSDKRYKNKSLAVNGLDMAAGQD